MKESCASAGPVSPLVHQYDDMGNLIFSYKDREQSSETSLPPSLCTRCWDLDTATARPGGSRSLHSGLQQARIAVANTSYIPVAGAPLASLMAVRSYSPQEIGNQQCIGRQCEVPRKSQWQRRALGLSAQKLDNKTLDPSSIAAQSHSEETKEPAQNQNTPRSRSSPYVRYLPYSAEWTVARLRDSPSCAIPLLRSWSHSRRFREINPMTVQQINALPMDKAITALMELKKPRIYVRGSRGSKLTLKSTIMTLDTRDEKVVEALIDSGCEGSCIDVKYVREHNLSTTPLP